MSLSEAQAGFPGTLYDGDGTVLAGSGPAFAPALTDDLPYKALVRAEPGAEAVAVLEAGDRLWLLPEGFGAPSELPMALLVELAGIVRRGGKVALAARSLEPYAPVRDALMLLLDESGGRA